MHRFVTALVASLLGLSLLAGCGGGKKTTSSSSSPTSSGGTSTQSGTALTKQQYEAQATPLLTNAGTALTQVAGNPSSASTWDSVATKVQTSHDQLAAITPPSEVADLHQQAVSVLGAIAQDCRNARDAINNGDSRALAAAGNDLKTQGQKLQSIGSQFTARGY